MDNAPVGSSLGVSWLRDPGQLSAASQIEYALKL
jgi:hypothetical protein